LFNCKDWYYKLIDTPHGLDRKLFYNVKFDEREEEQLIKVKKLFRKNKVSYKNFRNHQNRLSRWKDGDIMKQIYTGDWDDKKTLRCAK